MRAVAGQRTASIPRDLVRRARRHSAPWLVGQAAVTLATLWLVWIAGRGLAVWALDTAQWAAVGDNLRRLALGRYPADLAWRPAMALVALAGLTGASAPRWGHVGRGIAHTVVVALVTLLVLPVLAPAVRGLTDSGALADLAAAHAAGAPWFAAALAALAAGWVVGQRLADHGMEGPKARRGARWLRAAWILALPTVFLLLRGVGDAGAARRVPSLEWGGLLLTLLLAMVAIALSFPLGVLLALGRRSGLPLVRALSVGYIELIRGVPLISVLFMARVMAPLVLPDGVRPDDVLRAVIGFTLFSAAYTAENVRGGLAAIPRGQYDAASALGLGTLGTYYRVVLPQALRAVIPALVGQFISLFKDTSLVAIVGLNELLGTALQIVNNPDYLGLYRETFVYVAVIYFVISYAMSDASRRLEAAVRVGGP